MGELAPTTQGANPAPVNPDAGWLSRNSLKDAVNDYRSVMARSPLQTQLTHGVPLALTGYALAPWLLGKILGPGVNKRRARILGTAGGMLLPTLATLPWYMQRRSGGASVSDALLKPSDFPKKSGFEGFTAAPLTPTPSPEMYGTISDDPSFNPFRPTIGVGRAIATVDADPYMSEAMKLQAKATIQTAAASANQQRSGGLFSTHDLINAGIGGGLGYLGGALVGTVLGLPPSVQNRLAQGGALAGIARATGIWRD